MKLPELSEEQAQALNAKKKAFAQEQGKGDDVCQNLKCRCVECTCGAGCTCNVSTEVTCDDCKSFKKTMIASTNKDRLESCLTFYKEKVAPNFEGVTDIRVDELKSIMEKGSPEVLLVDVRSEAERSVSIIPKSVSAAEFEANMEGLGSGKLVIPYCTIGGRSAGYAKKMLDLPSKPWAEIRNWQLSILDWCYVGGELVEPGGAPTTRVHASGPGWVDMFPIEGYEVVIEPKM